MSAIGHIASRLEADDSVWTDAANPLELAERRVWWWQYSRQNVAGKLRAGIIWISSLFLALAVIIGLGMAVIYSQGTHASSLSRTSHMVANSSMSISQAERAVVQAGTTGDLESALASITEAREILSAASSRLSEVDSPFASVPLAIEADLQAIEQQLANDARSEAAAELRKGADAADKLWDDLYSGGQLATEIVLSTLSWFVVIIALAIVSAIGLCVFIARRLTGDIAVSVQDIIVAMSAIANGEKDTDVPYTDRRDDVGAMARSLEHFRNNARRVEDLHRKNAVALQEKQELQARNQHELAQLASSFEGTIAEVVSGVAAASSQLHSTATDMSATAEHSTKRSEDVARSMEEAAAGASAAAAASDEFAMSIGEISRQAADSAEMARKARSTASEADETISALDVAASQIGQVVELISTIASRTNLLALNASIEAARGGEAGRGFAVVASEVKELASQTTRATEDVARQIEEIQRSTGASVAALRTVSSEIQQIESTAIAIASAVDQQSVAGQDLARSIDRAARNSESVGEHVSEVREYSLRTGSAAAQVLNSASELEKQASTLRSQVDGFMARIRATADS